MTAGMAEKKSTLLYNAKTLPYDQPGSAASNYGYTPDNIGQNLSKLFTDYKVKGIEDGGNEAIFKALEKRTARFVGEGNPQAQLFDQYLKTGVLPAGIDPNFAVDMLDFGVRETSRAQQNKDVGLFEKIVGPLLTIGASAIPGIGPLAGAAVGGYIGSRNGGSPLDIALGAVGGYASGASIAKAGGITQVAKNVGTAVTSPIQTLKYGLPLDNVNQFFPADIAARAGTSAAAAASTFGGSLSSVRAGADLATTLLGGAAPAIAPSYGAGATVGGGGGNSAVAANTSAGPALSAGFGGDTRIDRSLAKRNRTGANTLLGAA